MNDANEFSDEELAEAFRLSSAEETPSESHIESLRSQLLAQTSSSGRVLSVERLSARAFAVCGLPAQETTTGPSDVQINGSAQRAFGITGKLALFAAMTALIVVAVMPFSVNAAASLTTALRATRMQLWIHAKTVIEHEGELTTSESWCSPLHRIAAFRSPQHLHFVNYQSGIQSSSSIERNIIYHWRANPRTEEFGRTFVLALLSEDNLQSALPMHTISRIQKSDIQVSGRPGIQYSFALESKDQPSVRQKVVVQVDRSTRQIVAWDEDHSGGMRVKTVFDYPESGPRDIYELGAARNAEVVDRVASSDIVRMAEKFGQQVLNFGDYEAIVIDQLQSKDGSDIGAPLYRRFRRDGVRFQVDLLKGSQPNIEVPPDAEFSWWQSNQSLFQSTPLALCDGKSCTIYPSEDARLAIADELLPLSGTESVVPIIVAENQTGSITIPVWPSVWPEYACRPMIITSDPTVRFEIDPAGSDGPADTLRLRVLKPDSPFSVEPANYWLDPDHDYCVVKSLMSKPDFDMLAGSPRERKILFEFSDFVQSPTGIQYARKRVSSDLGTQQRRLTRFILNTSVSGSAPMNPSPREH